MLGPRKSVGVLLHTGVMKPSAPIAKLTKHESHPTRDLKESADHVKPELFKDKSRLESAVMLMEKRTNEAKKACQALQDKKATVKTVIHNRHATLVAMADKFRDELLGSLDAATEKMEIDLTKSVSIMMRTSCVNCASCITEWIRR